MGDMTSQITSLTIVYSTVYSRADQRKAPRHWPLCGEFIGDHLTTSPCPCHSDTKPLTNQCWFHFKDVSWNSHKNSFTVSSQSTTIPYHEFANHSFDITATSPRIQWVNSSTTIIYQIMFAYVNLNVISRVHVNEPTIDSLHDDVIKWKQFPRYLPFVREFTGDRWIPRTKTSDAELWCFLWSSPERLSKQSWGWWFETPSGPLWRHCNVKPNDGYMRRQPRTALVQIMYYRLFGAKQFSEPMLEYCQLGPENNFSEILLEI